MRITSSWQQCCWLSNRINAGNDSLFAFCVCLSVVVVLVLLERSYPVMFGHCLNIINTYIDIVTHNLIYKVICFQTANKFYLLFFFFFFFWDCLSEVSQNLHGDNLHWSLHLLSSLGYTVLIQFQGQYGVQKMKIKITFSWQDLFQMSLTLVCLWHIQTRS